MAIGRRRFLGFLVPFGVVAGCATTKPPTRISVESRVQNPNSRLLAKVVIVTPLKPSAEEPNIWPSIATELKKRGVACETFAIDPLELERVQKLQQAIRQLEAEHLLLVGRVGAKQMTRSNVNGALSKGTVVYHASLITVADRKTTWRAQLAVTYWSLQAQDDLNDEIAEALVSRLVSDGFMA